MFHSRSSMSREMTASPRRHPSSPAAPPPLEDEDLLAEILFRLPPQPSSLPRARAVSRRWRSLASDPRFCARFRAHHGPRNPKPLLGCFTQFDICFHPALEAPNRVPEGRLTFPFPIAPGDPFMIFGCRHGLVLVFEGLQDQLLVWDPVTGDQHRLDVPPWFDMLEYLPNGAVLRAAGDHFQVVLVGSCDKQHAPAIIASVYSSKTGAWGNLVSTPLPCHDSSGSGPTIVCSAVPAVMVGNSLYCLFTGNSKGIIEFDLDSWSLALIPMPEKATPSKSSRDICVIPAEGGGLGFLFLSQFSAQSWKRKTNCDGVASWVLGRTIALDKLLPINLEKEGGHLWIIGLAEENNMVLVHSSIGIFTFHLESLESKNIFEPYQCSPCFCPFEGVYTAEKGIDGGHDGAELLQNV